jgi:ribose 5-phosphate isomerase B
MHIYLGSDHGGFEQKQMLARELAAAGYAVEDCGPHTIDPSDDYPDYALKVARAVQKDPDSCGILLCRSGEGMEMVANKLNGIRAALVWRPDVAAETRSDNLANILVLPSDFVANHDALVIAKTFIDTPFSGEERHQKRIDKIAAIERGEL